LFGSAKAVKIIFFKYYFFIPKWFRGKFRYNDKADDDYMRGATKTKEHVTIYLAPRQVTYYPAMILQHEPAVTFRPWPNRSSPVVMVRSTIQDACTALYNLSAAQNR